MSSQGVSDRTGGNGHSGAGDVLYALSDEQILEMEPAEEVASGEAQLLGGARRDSFRPDRNLRSTPAAGAASARNDDVLDRAAGNDALRDGVKRNEAAGNTGAVNDVAGTDGVEPPEWLARMMEDPRAGGEARDFWEGILRARAEGAAYRAAIATPEEARALRELYPGGVNDARAAAERARQLEQIDRVYFGAPGMRPEEAAAARTQLAQTLLREDPAAFREMVAAGVKLLQEATEAQSHGEKNAVPPGMYPGGARRGASAAGSGAAREDAGGAGGLRELAEANVAPPGIDLDRVGRAPSAAGNETTQKDAGLPARPEQAAPGATAAGSAPEVASRAAQNAQLAAYGAFERAANEELERSVGGAIARTLEQALPNARNNAERAIGGARAPVPLHERLGALIREEIEAGLKSDRQLGEQVAQLLAARRFDEATRAQVVGLIGERARQLVPGAARRVLNEWTQTALAAHRARTGRGESASSRVEVAAAAGERELPRLGPGENRSERSGASRDSLRNDKGGVRSSRVDYRKMSDEQILEM